MTTRFRFRTALGLSTAFLLAACGGAQKVPPDQQLAQLKDAIYAPVVSRTQNLDNSELLQSVVNTDVLIGMHRDEIARKLGKGEMCGRVSLCSEQGFENDDWHYAIGNADEEQTGKRASLIIGFNRFGTAERVYNLHVH